MGVEYQAPDPGPNDKNLLAVFEAGMQEISTIDHPVRS